MLEHKLLDFCVVSDIAVVVDTPCIETRPSHLPASASN